MKHFLRLFILLFSLQIHVSAQIQTVVQTGHAADIFSYDISIDNKYLISLDNSLKVVLWDLSSGRQLKEFKARLREGGVRKAYFDKRRSNLIYLRGSQLTDIYDIRSNERIGLLNNEEINFKSTKNELFDIEHVGSELKVFNAETKQLVNRLKSFSNDFSNILINKSGEIIAIGNKYPVVWNLQTGYPLYRLSKQNNMNIIFSPDSTQFITAEAEKQIDYWNFENGDHTDHIPLDSKMKVTRAIKLDDNGKLGLLTNLGFYIANKKNKTIEPNLGTTLPYTGYRNLYALSDRNSFIFTHQPSEEWSLPATIFESRVDKLKEMKILDYFGGGFKNICIKPNRTEAIAVGGFQLLKRYSYPEMVPKEEYAATGLATSADLISSCYLNDTLFAAGATDGNIYIYQTTDNLKYIKTLSNHKSDVNDIKQSPDGRFFYSASSDGTMRMWNSITQELIATFVIFDDELEYVIYTPDNYYMSSKNAFEGIHFIKGLQVIRFDQFDLQYNRPDIVLSRLGYSSQDLIDLFYSSYKKRLRRMNFTEEMFSKEIHIPEITIKRKEEIVQNISDSINLQISAWDDKFSINRVNVWLNNVSLTDEYALYFDKAQRQKIDTTITVQLASGKNIIELSSFNEHGAESYRESIEIFSQEKNVNPDLHLICIGVSSYQDPQYNLKFAHTDALRMQSVLEDMNKEHFNKVHSYLLTNEDAIEPTIRSLKNKLKVAKRDDTVIVFYAGHGILDNDFNYYLATYDTDFSNPNEKGMTYEDFEGLLSGIKPLKKLLLIDACHSGTLDKDDILIAEAGKATSGTVRFRDVGVNIKTKNPPNIDDINRMLTNNFADLSKGIGATVIASSSGVEVSVEGDIWGNGLFTYALLDGIGNKKADTNNDHKISISEIQSYTNKLVQKLSDGYQQPTSRIENVLLDFTIAY